MPVIGIIDSLRGQTMLEEILQNIATTNSRVVILDILGVETVDSAVANHLIKITQATRLMGCECVISGISPAIAQTITQLGIPLEGVTTRSKLKDAVALAYERTKQIFEDK